MKRPAVELSDCIGCEICVDLCPQVFRWNAAGYVELADLEKWPEQEIDEVIKHCPADCVFWER